MVISLTRLEPSRTENLQCQNLIDNFNFGRLVGNSIECSLLVVATLAVWLLQCSYQLNYGKIETRHHCGKQCWTLVMTQWDCSEQDIYHFPWHQVRSVMRVPSVKWWDTSLGTNIAGLAGGGGGALSLSGYESGTLALWATLQTSFGFMTGLTLANNLNDLKYWPAQFPAGDH